MCDARTAEQEPVRPTSYVRQPTYSTASGTVFSSEGVPCLDCCNRAASCDGIESRAEGKTASEALARARWRRDGDQRRYHDANDLDRRYSSGGHRARRNIRSVSCASQWRSHRRSYDRPRDASPVGSLAMGQSRLPWAMGRLRLRRSLALG